MSAWQRCPPLRLLAEDVSLHVLPHIPLAPLPCVAMSASMPAPRCRWPVPVPGARGPSPRPPAGGWGCAVREGAASIICAVSGGEWRTIQKRRRAATSPGCRHAAGTPVARLRRSGKIRMAGPGGITRFAHPLPAARSCASRPLSVAAGRRRAEGIPICPSIAPLHSTRHVIVLPVSWVSMNWRGAGMIFYTSRKGCVWRRFSARPCDAHAAVKRAILGFKSLSRPAPRPPKISILAPLFGFTTDLVLLSTHATSLVASGTFPQFGLIRIRPNWRPHFWPPETGGNSRHFCRSSGHSEGSHMPPKRGSGK